MMYLCVLYLHDSKKKNITFVVKPGHDGKVKKRKEIFKCIVRTRI